MVSSLKVYFCEARHNEQKLIVDEIYRVPETNERISVQRYESILQQLSGFHGDVMIGTDQIFFNYLEIERHLKTRELLDLFISSGFLPTVTLPTRITYSSSTLIDNIYIKCRNLDHLVSGIIISDLSDHLPLFTFLGKPTREKTLQNNYV